MLKLFLAPSPFPGQLGSHCTPEVPGSIHEGGELGYSISHAFGAAFDNPDLIVSVVVGDGEAETGPLATSWHSNKFLNPIRDGAVLPILHLNGYKIANPTLLARISPEELEALFTGYGWTPHVVEGDDPEADASEDGRGGRILRAADPLDSEGGTQHGHAPDRPRWPMIILRTPKGWTGPKQVDGHKVEGFLASASGAGARCADQSRASADRRSSGCAVTSRKNYSTKTAGWRRTCASCRPAGERRMSANPHANGGKLRKPLNLPDFRDYAVADRQPGHERNLTHGDSGQVLARRHAAQHEQLSPVQP